MVDDKYSEWSKCWINYQKRRTKEKGRRIKERIRIVCRR